MEKKHLVKFLDQILIPLGFKRKGNSWMLESDALIKIINLQKSNYGNFFYINYGYIIKGLELSTATHIENRLTSIDKDEQKKIKDLLDLETNIPMDNRLIELKKIIIDEIITKIEPINTENDLLNELKKRPQLNDIPLIVKKHFNFN